MNALLVADQMVRIYGARELYNGGLLLMAIEFILAGIMEKANLRVKELVL
jgi:hypothetical protein